MTTRRAFSLVEVAVALAIAGVVIAIAATVVTQMNGTVTHARVRQQADEEAKLLGEWFIFQMRGLGGDDLRPWEAIEVENDCAARGDLPDCGGSDRLTVRIADPDISSCGLIGSFGANVESNLIDSPPLGNGDGLENQADDTCCLDVVGGAAGPSPWENRSAFLIDSDRVVHPVALHTRTSAGGNGCGINLPAGLPVADAKIPGGRLIVATQQVFFRAPTTSGPLVENGLYAFEDANFDDRFDPGELTLIADNVFDLQLALGYDHDKNGRVIEDGSTADELHLNAAGDALPAGFEPASLRQLAVGLVVGVPLPARGAPPTAQVLDGPTRTSTTHHLRGTVLRATLRNIFLFD